jgi:hypothetical protein
MVKKKTQGNSEEPILNKIPEGWGHTVEIKVK